MPKMKTHKGLKKRFKVGKRGAVKRSQAFSSHLMSSKSPKRRRHLRRVALVVGPEAKKIRVLLGAERKAKKIRVLPGAERKAKKSEE